jgi:RimJ/RimL family protein N-acetyltransferase
LENEELREQTASEPLTLAEHYDLCAEWEADPKKWIYIIMDATDPAQRRMVGDVNLFLHDYLAPGEAELLIMIAEPAARRQGLAAEAVTLMMRFAEATFHIRRFIVKIASRNLPSQRLFHKLGFRQFSFDAAFDEIALDFPPTMSSSPHSPMPPLSTPS